MASSGVPSPVSSASLPHSSTSIGHSSNHTSFGTSDAALKVSRALKALAVVNKFRYENINYNKYEFTDPKKTTGKRVTAPPLDYSTESVQKLYSMEAAYGDLSNDGSMKEKRDNTTKAAPKSLAYTISPELAEAARILAESAPPSPSTGKESALAAAMQAKYGQNGNDTNMAAQVLRGPNGLVEYAPFNSDETLFPVSSQSLHKRAASGSQFWMANIEQRGVSPFAPDGYKVWRNVKDYGAKGTYLVSSSIIQYYNTQFLGDVSLIKAVTQAPDIAYLGNQQFTSNHLVFVNCKTALQIHWDWAWTMQDVVIESCGTGIVVTGGNVGFYNVEKAIMAERFTDPILAGGNEVLIDAWGFGLYAQDYDVQFAQQRNLPAMQRSESLTGSTVYNKGTPNFFVRRRPQYFDIGHSQVFDVKAYGARGDGKTDDTAVLNSILSTAANMSSIVYFPYGIYVVKDTLNIPKGSRIVGQAWSQIMATGSKFQDAENPHVAVKVGEEGDVGIVEIQDMMFTVSGPTAGAVLMEWNVHESTQGSAGLWDSHFRVGGAKGSNLQAADCPKQPANINKNCIAASLLLRITKSASAYMENVWAWTADHDLDITSQDQVDIYSARGILIESQGPTWMYGTSCEHNVLYQYQLSGAQNLVMGMIQTESPYFQPTPAAPEPFKPGTFPNDPDFSSCDDNKVGAFYVEQTNDLWVFNLVTKAIVKSITPLGHFPLWSRDVRNGYTASLLAWLFTKQEMIGKRKFDGFYLYDSTWDEDLLSSVSSVCKTAMTRLIECHEQTYMLSELQWRAGLQNDTLTDLVCEKTCGESIEAWFESVTLNCADYHQDDVVLTKPGGILWAGWNETCVKDPDTGKYCGDVINDFTVVNTIDDMPTDELCSYCYVKRYEMMQSTSYSIYDETYQSDLIFMNSKCDLSAPTVIPPPIEEPANPYANNLTFCASDTIYTTVSGDTCDTIALKHSVSSAALFIGNPNLFNCKDIPAGIELCLPFTCEPTYTLKDGDTCVSIEKSLGLDYAAGYNVRKYNPWLTRDCSNLQEASNEVYGKVLCGAPQGGTSTGTAPPVGVTSLPQTGDDTESPPPTNTTVPEGTTLRCARWHVVADQEAKETCAKICVKESIDWELFLKANPSLTIGVCDEKLVVGNAYCVGPIAGFDSNYSNSGDDKAS
ncbi:hypothetical protein APSETT445_008281 [Aspergillus pseudonomiae]